MCDFQGYIVPEIVKKRPVVVISPRLPYRSHLCTVVPLSTARPDRLQPYHYEMSKNPHPREPDDLPVWAKCDLLANVTLKRLDRFKVGRRKYYTPRISDAVLEGIRVGVLHALGFGKLTEYL